MKRFNFKVPCETQLFVGIGDINEIRDKLIYNKNDNLDFVEAVTTPDQSLTLFSSLNNEESLTDNQLEMNNQLVLKVQNNDSYYFHQFESHINLLNSILAIIRQCKLDFETGK